MGFLPIVIIVGGIIAIMVYRNQSQKKRQQPLGVYQTSSPSTPAQGVSSVFNDTLRSRYSDSYTEAHAVVSIGKAVKKIGGFLFAALFLVGFCMLFSNGKGGIGAIIMGVGFVIGVPIYILGILVAAQGQTQLASLDTAVNNSRHLTNDEVAQVLSKRFSL